jgi:YihY family inner membrane protein
VTDAATEGRPVEEAEPSRGGTLRRLYGRAFQDDLTGLAAMVAYNLLLSVFPLAVLALFIFSRVLQSDELQASVVQDLRQLFPSAAESTLINLLDRIRGSTTGLGIIALVASIWICTSFWGALDTAFCRIYHMECRSWLRQKRFGLLMLVVSLLFIGATVAVPALQSVLVRGADDLPLGLSEVPGLVYAATLAGGIVLMFLILSVIYLTVPHGRVPLRAVWPGALAATIAITIVDYAFPAYLTNISTLAGLGTSLVFIVIVLIWFYVLAIIVLGGAEINAYRLEEGADAKPAADARAATGVRGAESGGAATEPLVPEDGGNGRVDRPTDNEAARREDPRGAARPAEQP